MNNYKNKPNTYSLCLIKNIIIFFCLPLYASELDKTNSENYNFEKERIDYYKPYKKKKSQPDREISFINSIGIEFVYVESQRNYSFFIQKSVVTQDQWSKIMGSKCTITEISYNDIQKFISKLSKKEGVYFYSLPTQKELNKYCYSNSCSNHYEDKEWTYNLCGYYNEKGEESCLIGDGKSALINGKYSKKFRLVAKPFTQILYNKSSR